MMSDADFQKFMVTAVTALHADMAALKTEAQHIKTASSKLEAAVFGDPSHGFEGLLTDVAVIKDKTPGKVKRAGISGIAGVVGSVITIVATVLSGKVG